MWIVDEVVVGVGCGVREGIWKTQQHVSVGCTVYVTLFQGHSPGGATVCISAGRAVQHRSYSDICGIEFYKVTDSSL